MMAQAMLGAAATMKGVTVENGTVEGAAVAREAAIVATRHVRKATAHVRDPASRTRVRSNASIAVNMGIMHLNAIASIATRR